MTKVDFANSDSTPKCPYCEKEITTIERVQKNTGLVIINYIFLCPNCKKILSISSSH